MDYRMRKMQGQNAEAESILDLTFDGQTLHWKGQEAAQDRPAVKELRALVDQFLSSGEGLNEVDQKVTTLLELIEKGLARFRSVEESEIIQSNIELYEQARGNLENLLDGLDAEQPDLISGAISAFEQTVRDIDHLLDSQETAPPNA